MTKGTDVSSFKKAYKTAIEADFPKEITLTIGDKETKYGKVKFKVRYGTNPHQPFAAYAPKNRFDLSIGNMEILKGGKSGLSLTNMQDMSQAYNILKYFDDPACAVMKHVVPCGFDVLMSNIQTGDKKQSTADIYRIARSSDERSAYGSVVGFNTQVDEETAEAIMETFVEGVIAPSYKIEALNILRRNEDTPKLNNGIRVAVALNMDKIPKYVGDDVSGHLNIRNLADGTLTLEIPYLTRIKSAGDFITDPMIPNSDPRKNRGKDYVVQTMPTEQQLADALTAWYVNIGVRSNGVVFVKDGTVLAVGTGEQERVGAVEQAIDKAIKKGHNLEGSIMSSDAFFPQRDCIDAVAKEGVKGVVWPAGSKNDALVIEAANEHNIALMATLERCFLHI